MIGIKSRLSAREHIIVCCRTALFIKSCLELDSPIVSTVAHYGIYCGRMNSHLGRNAFFCCSRYDVTDIISVTRHMVSHYANGPITIAIRARFDYDSSTIQHPTRSYVLSSNNEHVNSFPLL